MSNEAQKEPRPTTKFGSIRQQRETVAEFDTIGPQGKQPMPVETAPAQKGGGEDMKRQTVYMPKRLAQRLKVHAAATNDDISGIITRLVETYLDGVEGKP